MHLCGLCAQIYLGKHIRHKVPLGVTSKAKNLLHKGVYPVRPVVKTAKSTSSKSAFITTHKLRLLVRNSDKLQKESFSSSLIQGEIMQSAKYSVTILEIQTCYSPSVNSKVLSLTFPHVSISVLLQKLASHKISM